MRGYCLDNGWPGSIPKGGGAADARESAHRVVLSEKPRLRVNVRMKNFGGAMRGGMMGPGMMPGMHRMMGGGMMRVPI